MALVLKGYNMTTEQLIKKSEERRKKLWVEVRALYADIFTLDEKIENAYKKLQEENPLTIVPDNKYWNSQKYSECQLITLWNAYIYYGIRTPKRYGKIYDRVCKQAGCTYGSCLNTSKVKSKFKLEEGVFTYEWISANLPTEIVFYIPKTLAAHSALVIDANHRELLIANYMMDGSLYWVPFKTIQTSSTCKKPHRIIYDKQTKEANRRRDS